MSLLAFEALAVGTAMPTVARALDGLGLYALAFGGSFAAGVLAMVLSGIWCDARGPRAPMWGGVGLFVVGLFIAGSADAMGTLVIGRAVQGFGSGLLSVALYVVVGQAYPEQLRRRVFAAFAAAWVIPSLVGPAVAGLIVEHLGWRWVFLAVPVVALPAVLLVESGLRTLDRPTPAGPPAGAAARIGWAAGAGVSAALLHHGGQQRGALAVTLVVVALAGLGVCAPRLLPAGFLRAARGLPTVVGLRGLAAAAFAGAEVVIPLMLSRQRGFSPTAAGLVLTVGALSWSVGSWLQGRLPPPRSSATLPRWGLACVAAGTATVTLAVWPAVPVAVGVAGWAVAGLGMGLAYPSLSVLTLALRPRTRRAGAQQFVVATGRLAVHRHGAGVDRHGARRRDDARSGRLRGDARRGGGLRAARRAARRPGGAGPGHPALSIESRLVDRGDREDGGRWATS